MCMFLVVGVVYGSNRYRFRVVCSRFMVVGCVIVRGSVIVGLGV